jgi:hypothetical protein
LRVRVRAVSIVEIDRPAVDVAVNEISFCSLLTPKSFEAAPPAAFSSDRRVRIDLKENPR